MGMVSVNQWVKVGVSAPQIPPEGSLHRHRYPPRRRRGGGLLHHGPRHDRVLPQVRGVLPWHRRLEGKAHQHIPNAPLVSIVTVCVNGHLVIFVRCRRFLFKIQDIGAGKGKYYAVNYPLRDGIDDESYEAIFKPVSKAVLV